MTLVDPGFQMWVTLALILAALLLYAWERTPIEVTSLGIICALLVFFQFFPVTDKSGHRLLDTVRLLEGFGSPVLLTIIGLVIVGEGLVRTGLLDRLAQTVFRLGGGRPALSIALVLLSALVLSSMLNNIPVVVIFIPIMRALAQRLGRSASQVMIPLGYAAVMGGKLTLIGSSTNLLVSGTLVEIGQRALGFFEFTVPGLVLAGSGFLYTLFICPLLLRDRIGLAGTLIGDGGGGKQFIAQILVSERSKLVEESALAGYFSSLPDMTVRMIQRGEHAFMPPFEEFTIRPGDLLVVAATRNALVEAVKLDPGLLETDLEAPPEPEAREERWRSSGQVLVEVLVTPGSSMIGLNLEEIGFRGRYRCIVLGIQRRSRMLLERMSEIRLDAGDVLLIQGRGEHVAALRSSRDVAPMEASTTELPAVQLRWRAGLIFLTVVALMATGAVPTVIGALLGALAMVMSGALSVGQATRSVDGSIVLTIAAALGLGVALEDTGGALYLSRLLSSVLRGTDPALTISVFFLCVTVASNLLNVKACAVIFTPIGVNLARQLGLDPILFGVAVVFATNTAIASPIAHPATLLVMGPGHHRFSDFLKAGAPLVVLQWLVFTLVVPWYYHLG